MESLVHWLDKITLEGLASLLTAIGLLYNIWLTHEVRHNTNSIMDQRLAEARLASEAKGNLAGRKEQRKETENG